MWVCKQWKWVYKELFHLNERKKSLIKIQPLANKFYLVMCNIVIMNIKKKVNTVLYTDVQA